jgi:hypothetical protein
VHAPSDEQAGSDTRADLHVDNILGAARGAKGDLGQSTEVGVVVDHYRQAHPTLQLVSGSQTGPSRKDDRGSDDACPAIDRARQAHPDPGDVSPVHTGFLDANPQIAAAAAWSLVHGLAHLLLDGHFEQATEGHSQREEFIRKVTGAVRFAAAPQRKA